MSLRQTSRLLITLVPCLAMASCSTLTEEGDPSASCVSGIRWAGGDIGHEEMHPGRDCVGCHRENDGPPLVLGGTVYGVPTQDDECYGEEGVIVRLTDAQERVFEFVTNRAGNFYLEGDPSVFTPPFQAVVQVPGETGEHRMITAPETGSCAQCHGADPLPDGVAGGPRKLPFTRINIGLTLEDYGIPAPAP